MFDEFYMKIFSKLKEILEKLNLYDGKFSEISTKVDNTNTAVESVSTDIATVQIASNEIKSLIGTAISTQLSTLQKNIIAAIPSGSTACVKSVQRGISSFGQYTDDVTISISTVNVSKTVVILNGICTDNSQYVNTIGMPYLYKLTSTSFVISRRGDGTGTVSWQVIEFY